MHGIQYSVCIQYTACMACEQGKGRGVAKDIAECSGTQQRGVTGKGRHVRPAQQACKLCNGAGTVTEVALCLHATVCCVPACRDALLCMRTVTISGVHTKGKASLRNSKSKHDKPSILFHAGAASMGAQTAQLHSPSHTPPPRAHTCGTHSAAVWSRCTLRRKEDHLHPARQRMDFLP